MERLHVGGGHLAVHRFTHDPEPGPALATPDRPGATSRSPRGRCLLVPPFGVEAETLAPVGAALAAHGFETFAIDPRDHVGGGSGTITDFRLSTFADDCRAAITVIRPSCLVAVSLGARAAIRALAEGPASPAAVLVTPVVDFRHTLSQVLDRDWFDVPEDEVPPLVPVLGNDIAAPRFLGDAVAADFVSAERTVQDLSAYGGLVTVVPGSDDPWVDPASVCRAVDRSRLGGRARIRWVDCDRHTFHEDPELAIRIVGAMVDEIVDIHRPEALLR